MNNLFTPDMEPENELIPTKEDFFKFSLQYQQLIMQYESAIKCVTMRLEIMENEYKANGWHTAIRSISSRIKQPRSINRKLEKLGIPISLKSIRNNLNDIAGIRIICAYLSDIYTIRDALIDGHHIELVAEKDYIKEPKPNGYRSLHLIVDVPIPLKENTQKVRCEIQLRTTAMDSWAALEHQLRYKKDSFPDKKINEELNLCAEMLYETDLRMQKIGEDMAIFDKQNHFSKQ